MVRMEYVMDKLECTTHSPPTLLPSRELPAHYVPLDHFSRSFAVGKGTPAPLLPHDSHPHSHLFLMKPLGGGCTHITICGFTQCLAPL